MTRRRTGTDLLRAGALALVGHAALVGIIAGHARQQPPFLSEGERMSADLWADAVAAAASPTWVDLKSVSEALPEPEPSEPLSSADQASRAETETAPRAGASLDPARAAPDTGDGEGRRLPAAFRRDTSTLRARNADNASAYQISRERNASRASSPQPIRQEPRVGIADSAQSRRRRPADSLASRESLPTDAEGALAAQATLDPGQSQQTDTGKDTSRGDGPLAADQGRRRFEAETYGVAQETQNARAASNEPRPGRMELSAPAAAGAGQTGEGPAPDPGAVSRASTGTAPAVQGAPVPQRGPELAMSAAEREYQRNYAEIKRRVARTLRFPHRLALALEQGETVVHFSLRPDGRIDGTVRIVKSAGFDEFDAEAVSAVTRAAPFPPMSRTVSISMPIMFDNPMVR